MRQDRDEPVRAFGARLRWQASVCKFTQQCSNCEASVDYTEAMVKDVLCRGLEDSEIQIDLLGDKNQDMTLKQVFRFVEAKEAGKRSASYLLLPQATDAVAGRSYRKQKTPAKDQETCTYCGIRGMGEIPRQESGGRNAQPLAPSATTVTKTTTLRKCTGANMERSQLRALNTRTQYPTHSDRSHQWIRTAPKEHKDAIPMHSDRSHQRIQTAPKEPVWTTTFLTSSQRHG